MCGSEKYKCIKTAYFVIDFALKCVCVTSRKLLLLNDMEA